MQSEFPLGVIVKLEWREKINTHKRITTRISKWDIYHPEWFHPAPNFTAPSSASGVACDVDIGVFSSATLPSTVAGQQLAS